MLNQRLSAAKAVAAELFPAENDLESAILHHARLTIAVVEGRRSAKLPIATGQEGLRYIVRATERLVEARGEIANAHAALRETREEIGLRAVAFGDFWDCPPKNAAAAGAAANVA